MGRPTTGAAVIDERTIYRNVNRAIRRVKGQDRETLAAAAVDSIFRYQSAARQTDRSGSQCR